MRASGADRYAVAARVNALAWPAMAPGTAYLANGRETTNAFAGALLAARQKRPLYYTVPVLRPGRRAPGAGRRRASRGWHCSAARPRCACSPAGSRPAAASTRHPASGCSSTSGTPCPPRASCPPTSSCRRCRMPTGHTAALRRGGRAGPDGRRPRTPRGPGASASTPPTARTPRRRRCTTSTSRCRGRTWTDTWYLRAGYSEHQTGLTVDLLPIGRSNCWINDCIDETPQGVWLARNAWRFGFMLRYEKGRTSTTGVGLRALALPVRRGPRWPRATTTAAGTPTSSSSTSPRPRPTDRHRLECGNGRRGNHLRTHGGSAGAGSPRAGAGR